VTEHCDLLVVGAGHAGLSAAYHARQAGRDDILVVEAESRPGGWAKTDWTGAWGADRAIHVLYFRDPAMRDWVGDLLHHRWDEHDKRCVIDSQGVRTPYPFHANLRGRPPEVVAECLAGLWEASIERARRPVRPVSFADWILLTSGPGVARHFMMPFNAKQWTVPPSAMGCDWMGDFLPEVEPERILHGALLPGDSRVGLNATFFYPQRGICALAEALAEHAGPIHYDTSVIALDAEAHIATLSTGTRVRYEAMASTMSLHRLGGLLGPLPASERAALARLECVDLLLVDVGFEGEEGADIHWAYLPDPDVLAYRLHSVHALSRELMPAGHGLYCLEISHSRHRPLPRENIRTRVIDDLVRTGWLRSASDVRFYRERRLPCSYVLPRVGYRRDASRLRDYARARNIHSIGRYGEWKYSNQEDALLDGRRLIESLVGTSEPSR